MNTRLFYFVLALGLVFACAGCAMQNGLQIHLAAKAEESNLCRVAVLPFANETGRNTAEIKAYRIFLGELVASGNYEVESEGEVYFFLNRNRLRSGDLLDSQLYTQLAEQLEVDAIVRGRVIAMEYRRGRDGEMPFCDLQVDLISAEDGELLASAFHRRSGEEYQKLMHFGTIRTASGLMAQMSREIIKAWKQKGLSGCSKK